HPARHPTRPVAGGAHRATCRAGVTPGRLEISSARAKGDDKPQRAGWRWLGQCEFEGALGRARATRPLGTCDGGGGVQGCYALAGRFPNRGQLGMPCNCTQGVFNNGGQARSMHNGGVNIAMGDGGVRFIKDQVQNKIWWALLTSNDAFVLSVDQY